MNIGPDLSRFSRQLRDYEGEMSKPYICSGGYISIGVGRNLDTVGLSRDEIDILLRNDITRVCTLAKQEPWWPMVANNDARARALLDMLFNLGLGGLRSFRRMLAAIERGDWAEAAIEIENSKYFTQVGRRARDNQYRIRHGRDPE